MPNTSNPQTPATCEPMLTKTQPASDLKLAMEHRMRKSGTACKRCLCQDAGPCSPKRSPLHIQSWPWKTACEKAEQQQDSSPTHTTKDLVACKPPNKPNKKVIGRKPLHNKRLGSQQKGAWGAPPKKQNSSRIRVHAMLNRNHKKCRNVAYGTH